MKIRMTDSIELDKFKILKPEVELDFDCYGFDEQKVADCAGETTRALAIIVGRRLREIAERTPEKEAKRLIASVNVDLRFRKVLKSVLKEKM